MESRGCARQLPIPDPRTSADFQLPTQPERFASSVMLPDEFGEVDGLIGERVG